VKGERLEAWCRLGCYAMWNLQEPTFRRNLAFLRSVRRLLVTATVVHSSPILVTLMKEALTSSVTSVLTTATRCNIPEDTMLHSHRRENLKSYMVKALFVLKANREGALEYLHRSLASCKRRQKGNPVSNGEKHLV
jgi:hypothetical protein